MRNMAKSLMGGVVIVLMGYFVHGVFTYYSYMKAFEQTQEGETLQVVLERFGPPSHIDPRYEVTGYDHGSRSVCGQSCWLRLWYELPFTLGVTPVTVDFNVEQKVIHKYQWHSP